MSKRWLYRKLRARFPSAGAYLTRKAVAAGIVSHDSAHAPYVPPLNYWDDLYSKGPWVDLEDVAQTGNYSLLIGYLRYFGCRSIIDVGCGHGVLRSRLTPGDFESYVGVDPAAAAVELARRCNYEQSDFFVGDVFLPQLQPADAVVCNEVLYYVRELDRVLDRICDLVKPGCYLLTSHTRYPEDPGLYRSLTRRLRLLSAYELGNETPGSKLPPQRIAAYQRTT